MVQHANSIIGSVQSTVAFNHTYDCAKVQNGGYTWHNKTLQAFLLHLQRKHRQNISSANMANVCVLCGKSEDDDDANHNKWECCRT